MTRSHASDRLGTLGEPRRLCWFVDPSTEPPTSFGFMRDPDGGALIIGGATGSHLTGHSETWWDKLVEIASRGCLPVEVAIMREVISGDWSPPALSNEDLHLLQIIQAKKA